MKFKLDKSVPSDVKFGTTHLVIEFDDPTEFDTAQRHIDSWFEQELGKLSPEVLAIMKDHSPKKFGGGGGFKKKEPVAPPQPGEYNNLVQRAAQAVGRAPDQTWHTMVWNYVGAYQDKQGKWKGPFHKGYDADVADAKTKGWDWKAGKHIERLTAVVKALEMGDQVTLRYAAGNAKDAMGQWETQWAEEVLVPVMQGSAPGAGELAQQPPDVPDWLSDTPTHTPTAMPDVPAFPSVGDFGGDNPPPPAGYGSDVTF